MAAKYQRPGLRSMTAIVLQGQQGNGKTLLGVIFTNLLGTRNTTCISQADLESQFNGHFVGKLFVIADEVVNQDNLRDTASILKKYVTDPVIQANTKNVPQVRGREPDVVYVGVARLATPGVGNTRPADGNPDGVRSLLQPGHVRRYGGGVVDLDGLHLALALLDHLEDIGFLEPLDRALEHRAARAVGSVAHLALRGEGGCAIGVGDGGEGEDEHGGEDALHGRSFRG
jgi:hypothetical protein